MLKKLSVKFLILVMIGVMSVSDLLAQTRIRFARGRTSATISTTIPGNGEKTYVLGVRSGQTLSATVSCGNGNCDFAQGDVDDTQYSEYIEDTGDTYITIHNHGNRATRVTMTVSVQ